MGMGKCTHFPPRNSDNEYMTYSKGRKMDQMKQYIIELHRKAAKAKSDKKNSDSKD